MSQAANPVHPFGHRLDLDTPIGVMTEGNLNLKVSARGKQVVLSVFNKKAGRGFEVAFSPNKAGELREFIAAAERTAGLVIHG